MNRSTKFISCSVACAVAGALAVGCARDKPAERPEGSAINARPLALAEPAPSDPVDEPRPEPVETSKAKSEAKVVFSPEVLRACLIGNVDEAPKFDFDSAALGQSTTEQLRKVGECVRTGPLQGRRLELIGRADPRGSDDYNMNLGERRAASVREYLLGQGVDASALQSTSRGEQDARGTDDATWQLDRRVDVELVP